VGDEGLGAADRGVLGGLMSLQEAHRTDEEMIPLFGL